MIGTSTAEVRAHAGQTAAAKVLPVTTLLIELKNHFALFEPAGIVESHRAAARATCYT
jgi:hypothetical protein